MVRRPPVIVPGHGAPCDHQLIATVVGYLEFILATAGKGIEAGLTPLDLARQTDLGEYAGWLDSERIVGNLHRAYADLGANKTEVDFIAALTDMVAYNGGRPLSCLALLPPSDLNRLAARPCGQGAA